MLCELSSAVVGGWRSAVGANPNEKGPCPTTCPTARAQQRGGPLPPNPPAPTPPLLQVQYVKRFKKKDVEVLGVEASAQAMREWGERNPAKFIGIVEKQFAESGSSEKGAESMSEEAGEGPRGRIQGDASES